MSRFASTQTSEGNAIATLADEAVFVGTRAYTALTSSNPTLTAAQFVNGIVNVSGQTAAQTVTTPSAAAIVALIPNVQVGSACEFVLQNANTSSGTATITAGSGVTVTGTAALAINKTQICRAVVTNATAGAEAVTVYPLLYAGA